MNYLQGYKLRRTLTDVRSEQQQMLEGKSGIPMRPTFREDLLHKLDILYLHYQHWGDVAEALGRSQSFVCNLRADRTTAGRTFLAKLDTEYRVAWHRIDMNLRAGRRVDEGSPVLERFREKRKAHNVGYRNTRRAKRESGRSSRPTKSRAVGQPADSATSSEA